MMCPNCDHSNANYSIFCGMCGAELVARALQREPGAIEMGSGGYISSPAEAASVILLGIFEIIFAMR